MRTLALIAAMAVAVGCTDKDPAEQTDRTQRERDSIIGQSALPGAHGVRGALRVADSADARRRRAEQIH